jgi:hypothetical protein
MTLPPVNQTCKFVTPEVLLDHGSLGATDGNKVSEQISCNVLLIWMFNLVFRVMKNIFISESRRQK